MCHHSGAARSSLTLPHLSVHTCSHFIHTFPSRGGTLLELVDLATGNTSVHKSPEPLLGFFFTETPGADAVLVGRACLELCEYAARRRGLR